MDNQIVLPTSPKKSFSWILIIFSLVCLGAAGWFYYQNLQLKQQIIENQQSPQAILPSLIPVPISSPDQKQISFPKLPVVVFEPPLSNDNYATQRAEIQKKIVEPFIDYYKYIGGDNTLVSLLIQQQSNESIKIQYPYSLIGIMENGTHGEALMQTNGVLSWWTPTCMGPCDYSKEFEQKYPQIVSITNP